MASVKVRTLCRNFARNGNCDRGDQCKFAHPRQIPCWHFQTDECTHNPCNYVHVKPGADGVFNIGGVLFRMEDRSHGPAKKGGKARQATNTQAKLDAWVDKVCLEVARHGEVGGVKPLYRVLERRVASLRAALKAAEKQKSDVAALVEALGFDTDAKDDDVEAAADEVEAELGDSTECDSAQETQ